MTSLLSQSGEVVWQVESRFLQGRVLHPILLFYDLEKLQHVLEIRIWRVSASGGHSVNARILHVPATGDLQVCLHQR
jgi:hypothetical protein